MPRDEIELVRGHRRPARPPALIGGLGKVQHPLRTPRAMDGRTAGQEEGTLAQGVVVARRRSPRGHVLPLVWEAVGMPRDRIRLLRGRVGGGTDYDSCVSEN